MTEFAPAIKTLVYEPNEAQLKNLVAMLIGATPELSLVEARTSAEAKELLFSGAFSLCFIGLSIDWVRKHSLLSAYRKDPAVGRCGLIAVSDQHDRVSVLSLLSAGAHGVLLAPIRVESLRATVDTVLARTSNLTDEAQEQVNSLPWILEGVARRLETIALNLAKTEHNEAAIKAEGKTIQEALLLAFSGRTEEHEQFTERLLKALREYDQ